MKKLIRNIIREQTDLVPDIPTETEWNSKEKKHTPLPVPSKKVFVQVVKQLVKQTPDLLQIPTHLQSDDRWWEMNKVLKLFGMNSNHTYLLDKLYWAAVDNKELIEKAEINDDINFDDLVIRPLKKYRVTVEENWTEHVWYTWQPIVDAYSEEDASDKIYMDEDGYYNYWDWDNEPGFSKDIGDSDSDGKEVNNVEEIGLVNESITIKESESPDENELIDGLRNILNKQKKAHSEDVWYNDITKLLKKLDISLK